MPKAPVLTPQSVDFPRWYQDVVAKAELAEGGPVRGSQVIRPYGYAIWERIQAELDARIKAAGAVSAYFPLLIPQSYLATEAAHVEGFSPELAVVTHGGGKALDEPVVIRPTSETIINSYFSKWITSHRDLPLRINQWCNVVRWEMRPRLLLRSTEFLWQEGHTAHATETEARAYALAILDRVYREVMVEVLGIPVLVGRKTERERFPGAVTTWTAEAMMGDGKALQMGTSHELGQGFARAFDITFQSPTGALEHVWQTSWGVSTRLLGGLVLAQGDDAGLRLAPRVAPIQVIVVLVRDEEGAGAVASGLVAGLVAGGVRAELDSRVETSYGRRVTEWELKGVPLRIEVGPRDLGSTGTVGVVRRDDGTRLSLVPASVPGSVPGLLDSIQAALLVDGWEARQRRTAEVSSVGEAAEAAQEGFARIPWRALGADGEAALLEGGASVRCLVGADGELVGDGEEAEAVAIVARAY